MRDLQERGRHRARRLLLVRFEHLVRAAEDDCIQAEGAVATHVAIADRCYPRAGPKLAADAEPPCTSTARTAARMMAEFSPTEQTILDDLVRRRTTSFSRPPWMQRHRETAISAEARRLIAASPRIPTDSVRPSDTTYYNAAARVRALGGRGLGYKIHEAGPDGRPICPMHQEGEWKAEHLGAGPVTCGKCAVTRGP
jgi:hypothetical protein